MTVIRPHIRSCRPPDGGRIAVATVGTGPPLVHAAHWLSHIQLDARSPVWLPWLRELSRGHTYIRYDQRGCGFSDWAPPSATLEAWISDLETVTNALGLRRFALFGMSQGAAPAIAFAARYPQRVSRLIVLGAYARGRLRREFNAQQHEEAQMLINLMRIASARDNLAFRRVLTMLFIPEGTPEQQQSLTDLARVATSLENAVAIRETLHQLDLTSLAKTVRVPTLVLHAREDAAVPFEEGRHLATLIPSARFVPLDSRNHLLVETEPAWSQFLGELRAFLAEGAHTASASHRHLATTQLTKAELQVLGLVARAFDDAAIAAKLGKSANTVRNQVSSILGKLGVRTRAAAVALARDAGIGTPTD